MGLFGKKKKSGKDPHKKKIKNKAKRTKPRKRRKMH